MRLVLLLAGVALALPVVRAQAAVITQNVTFGPGPTDYSSATGTTGTGGTTFSFFDTGLGTLTSITFGYGYNFNSGITVTNTAPSGSTGNVQTQSAAQFGSNSSAITAVLNSKVNNLNDPVDGNSVSFGATVLSPIAYDIRGSRSAYTLAPGQSATVNSSGTRTTSGIVDTDASDLRAFSVAGGGQFTPLFSTLTGLLLSNSGGNTSAVQTTTGSGTLTIAYSYTPTMTSIPEPASVVLLGAGLIGIGMLRRRSRAA